MPIHFAAARSVTHSPIARALAKKAHRSAANDNLVRLKSGESIFGNQDLMLKAALRHFAEHGIGAAREARKHAERAFLTGDRESYDWWLDVCLALDRRIAAELNRETAQRLDR